MTPQKLHRTAAILETITWALLLLGMTLKYSGTTDSVVPITGSIHGFGFLCFVVMTTLIWVNNRWTPNLGLTGLLVSVIPFAAWPFARWAEKQGHLEGGWRFRNTETETHPEGIFDWVLYQTVRYPSPQHRCGVSSGIDHIQSSTAFRTTSIGRRHHQRITVRKPIQCNAPERKENWDA